MVRGKHAYHDVKLYVHDSYYYFIIPGFSFLITSDSLYSHPSMSIAMMVVFNLSID